jgi:hypothetical protein
MNRFIQQYILIFATLGACFIAQGCGRATAMENHNINDHLINQEVYRTSYPTIPGKHGNY